MVGQPDSWSAAKDEYKFFRKDKVGECPLYAGAAQRYGGALLLDRQEACESGSEFAIDNPTHMRKRAKYSSSNPQQALYHRPWFLQGTLPPLLQHLLEEHHNGTQAVKIRRGCQGHWMGNTWGYTQLGLLFTNKEELVRMWRKKIKSMAALAVAIMK